MSTRPPATCLAEPLVVTHAVRPSRVAALVSTDLPAWQSLLVELAAYGFELWGGRWCFAAVPVEPDGSVPPLFGPLLRAFDPDHLVTFSPSLAALHRAGDAQAQHIAESWRQSLAGSGVVDVEFEVEHQMRNQSFESGGLTADTVATLAADLACFPESPSAPWADSASGDSSPGWPLTSWRAMADSAAGLPFKAVANPIVDHPLCRLMAGWALGIPSRDTTEWVRARGATVVDVPLFTEATMSLAIDSVTLAGSRFRADPIEDALEARLPQAALGGRSMLKASPYEPREPSQDGPTPIVVVGDGLRDALLWIMLSRLSRGVFWIPRHFLSASFQTQQTNPVRSYTIEMLNAIDHWSRDAEQLVVTSASLSTNQLGAAKRQLARSNRIGTRTRYLGAHTELDPDALAATVGPRVRCYEQDPFANESPLSLDSNDRSVTNLPSPTPRSAGDVLLGERRWIVDYKFATHILPPARGVVEQTVGSGSSGSRFTRITRDGDLALWYPHFFVESGAPITSTWRTRVTRPPTDLAMLRAVLGADFTVTLHDKGRYQSVVRRALGLDALLDTLESAEFGSLARRFLKRTSRPADASLYVGNRFALNLARLGERQRTPLTALLAVGLAAVVHVIKCPTCSHAFWLRLGSISATYECPRCSSILDLTALTTDPFFLTQRVTLNEAFYQFLEHRSDAPVGLFRRFQALDGAELTPEVEITLPSGDTFNPDFVAMIEGRLYLGETKTGENYATRQERAKLRRNLATIAQAIRPVDLVVVHAWIRPFTRNLREELSVAGMATAFERIPRRAWY